MKKLIIAGGGFAGAKIAKALESLYDTTLIDSKDYFEFTPGILRTILNPNHLKKIQVLHTDYLKKAAVITDSIKEISEKEVILSKNNQRIKFDFLVITLGSSYNFPFKEKDIVIVTRGNNLINSHAKLSEANKIAIIGGGIVGVELAGEITARYPGKKVIIIHKHNKLIERNNIKTTNYAKIFLTKKNVKIILNEKVISYKNNYIKTDNGTKVKADMVFICTGIKPNSKPLEKYFKTVLNEKGQIKVNEFLQVGNYKKIFAAGDITDINEEKLAQNAEKQASVIIKNMWNLENNKPLAKYNSKPRIMVISLGRFNGILQYKSFVLTGLIPAFLKTFVEFKTMVRYKS